MAPNPFVIKAHQHNYNIHPNPSWTATHVACTLCGLALHKRLLAVAVAAGATAEGTINFDGSK